MPSIQEIMARREASESVLDSKAKANRDEAEKRRQEKLRRRRIATALGVSDRSIDLTSVITEIAEILDVIDENRANVNKFRGDAEAVARLETDFEFFSDAIVERSSAVGEMEMDFLIALAQMHRSDTAPAAISGFIRDGVQKFKVFALLDESRGRERLSVLRDLKDKKIFEIPPEHKGRMWRFEHNNTTTYVVVARFAPNQKTEIAQASAYAEYFGDLFNRFLESRREFGQNIRELEYRAAKFTVELLNAGELGLLKMPGLFHVDVERERQKGQEKTDYVPRTESEDTCWKWSQPARNGGAVTEMHAWGTWYLRAVGPGRAIPEVSHLPQTHRLRKTMQHPTVGLLEADGRPKEITFGVNFANVRTARGFTPFSNPAKTRAFLCQSAGLKVERNEEVQAPLPEEGGAPTSMATAMAEATEVKRAKKNRRES